MSETRDERRLTTILAADVVGYSRLMGEDEAGTLAVLRERRREVIEPLLAKYQGRLVKLIGDGVLVEFASVVNAVQCAIEIQQGTEARNAALPEPRRMQLRIGINLGDVIIEGDDLYGDGVNLAARLEGLAEPGGVCISETAYQHVRQKLPLAYQDLGEQQVKNFAQPVRVYRVSARGGPGPAAIETRAATAEAPSIVVLPFTNMSGEAEQEFFADGLTEDIFAIQDEVTSAIVSTLPGRLEAASRERAARKPTGNMAAYECVLAGKLLHHRSNHADNEAALRLLDRAIALDANYAHAHAWKACVLGQSWVNGYCQDRDATWNEVGRELQIALELDSNDSDVQRVLAAVNLAGKEHDKAAFHQERALALNPNDDLIVVQQGEVLTWLGRPEEGIPWIEKAMRLNPYHPERFWNHLGHEAAARSHSAEVLKREPAFCVENYLNTLHYKRPEDREHHREALVKAGLPLKPVAEIVTQATAGSATSAKPGG